jgi:hypothetical protein
MPKDLERALIKAAAKKGYKGKRAKHFVYGTMTNMQEKGEISPWRKLKR